MLAVLVYSASTYKSQQNRSHDLGCIQITVVMKFGGSSVASAARMREVAAILCSFPDQLPCIVLSAMGKVGHPQT